MQSVGGKVPLPPNHLYAGTYTASPGTITKIDFPTFSEVAILTLQEGEDSIVDIIKSGNKLYVACHTWEGKVVKVDLATFTRETAIQFAGGENAAGLATHDDYLYVGKMTSPASIAKIHLPSFTVKSTLTLETNEEHVRRLITANNFLYVAVGREDVVPKIVKIDLATFTRDSALTVGAVGEINHPCDLAITGNYLYVGLYSSPGKIVKVNLKTFSVDSTLTLDTGEDNINGLLVVNNYLYAGLGVSPGKIVKIDLTNFTKVATLDLEIDEDLVVDLAGYDGYLYAGLSMEPAKVVKTNLTTFSKVSTLDLTTPEIEVSALCVA